MTGPPFGASIGEPIGPAIDEPTGPAIGGTTRRPIGPAVAIPVWRLLAVCAAGWLAGCGGRCPEVAAAKQSLLANRTTAPGPHLEIQIPLARANALLTELVRDPPITVPIRLPGPSDAPEPLGAMIGAHALTAVAREVQLRPAADDRLRFALRIELDDDRQPVTTLAIETEVTPVLVRDHGTTTMIVGFGPDNLLAVRPVLDGDAERMLGDAVARWLPPAIRDHVPRAVIDRAAGTLGEHLTGAAYQALQKTLLRRLGELTQLRLQLPELPIAKLALRSTATPTERLTIELTTDLPVRRGLVAAPAAAGPAGPAGDEITVRISGSTAAELANWAIDHGRLPQHYTRGLKPKPDGEFRPWLDYVAEDTRRPLKIHVFQEQGGCSYFRVGLRPALSITAGTGTPGTGTPGTGTPGTPGTGTPGTGTPGDQIEVATHDQWVETARASPVLEVALWLKQLLRGAVDESRKAAARTQLTIGGRTFTTRVVGAAVTADGELSLALQLTGVPPVHPTQPTVR
jgi:hypothetical protein